MSAWMKKNVAQLSLSCFFTHLKSTCTLPSPSRLIFLLEEWMLQPFLWHTNNRITSRLWSWAFFCLVSQSFLMLKLSAAGQRSLMLNSCERYWFISDPWFWCLLMCWITFQKVYFEEFLWRYWWDKLYFSGQAVFWQFHYYFSGFTFWLNYNTCQSSPSELLFQLICFIRSSSVPSRASVNLTFTFYYLSAHFSDSWINLFVLKCQKVLKNDH